ncbi:single strand DNA binding protein [Vibrio phage EniLVp02]
MSIFARRTTESMKTQIDNLTSTKKDYSDSNEWKLTVDKEGNGTAIIRFLPALNPDDKDFVKIFTHGFEEKGRWYVENCPTTHGEECPVCVANNELWSTEIEANKKIASRRKRKLSYWGNILVVKDSANPDAEGKVFKYRFGQKIMEKITNMNNGEPEAGIDGVPVTDVFEGANFILKAKKVDRHQNYDDSRFGNQAPIFKGSDDEVNAQLQDLANKMHDINSIVAADQFKPYDELETNLNKVLGKAATKSAESALMADLAASDGTQVDATSALDKTDSTGFDAQQDDDDLDALLRDLG